MVKKVFLLGRPGSGKSTVAREISRIAENKGWSTLHIFDYKLLQDMFLQEKEECIPTQEKKFLPKGPEDCKGFDVHDFSVLDTVLEKMAQIVRQEELKFSEKNVLILLEFARDNYSHALFLFGPDLLQDAFLLYLNVDLDICINRVHQRVNSRSHPYGHFVSDDIMRGYYRNDDWADGHLKEYLALPHSRDICVHSREIDNTGSHQDLQMEVRQLVDIHLIPEPVSIPELVPM